MADENRKGRSPRLVRCPKCGAQVGSNIAQARDKCPFCRADMKES